MTIRPEPSLLFLDVDGTIIPFGGGPGVRESRDRRVRSSPEDANPLLSRIDPGLGPALAALPCELVWATTWGAEADEVLAPLLGLPSLPVVDWPDDPEASAIDEWFGLHWKTRRLVEWADGRDFVWTDDEIGEPDREWTRTRHPGRSLLVRVDGRRGLAAADLAAVVRQIDRDDGA